jgi:hypothetical protein
VNIEDRLTLALHEEADRTDVDVVALQAATHERLARRSRTRLRFPSALAAAAAVAVVLVGGITFMRVIRDADIGVLDRVTGTSVEGGVANAFTCPRTVTVDAAGRRSDDSFLPDISAGPRHAADAEGAPRYEFTSSGDRAVLRLGNADGTLASSATFRRHRGGWDLVTTTKCAGADGSILVPDTDPLRLGRRTATPYPGEKMVGRHAVLIDDRSYFDVAGLVRHRSMWAAPCDESLCLASGKPTSMLLDQAPPPRGERPDVRDISSMFLPPDDMVGRRNPFRTWLVYDPEGRDTRVWARSASGRRVVEAKRITGPGWSGQAFVLLAPAGAAAEIVVDTADGSESTSVR